MPSRCFVFNEWLIHDIAGENGPERQSAAGKLLLRLRDGDDRVAVAGDTPWLGKAFSLMSVDRAEVRSLSKLLHLGIIRDSRKCLFLEGRDLERLPEDERRRLPRKDVYLVQLYRAAEADLIITTDSDFHDEARRLGIQIVLRDEFLAEYL